MESTKAKYSALKRVCHFDSPLSNFGSVTALGLIGSGKGIAPSPSHRTPLKTGQSVRETLILHCLSRFQSGAIHVCKSLSTKST